VADYYALIAQAVGGLDRNTGKARRAIYERARATQVTEHRAIQPPLSESMIAKERLALENAIRKVETDAARGSGTKPRETQPEIAPPRPDAGRTYSQRFDKVRPNDSPLVSGKADAPRPAPPLGKRMLRWLTGKRALGFGDVVNEVRRLDTTAEAAQDGSCRSEEPIPSPSYPPANGDTSPSSGDLGWSTDAEDLSKAHHEARRPPNGEPSYDLDEDQEALPPGQHLPRAIEEKYLQPVLPFLSEAD
jgi:hypothetical protein